MKPSLVYFNDQYIEVTSWNYGGASVINLDFDPIILPRDIGVHNLGGSIRIALNASKKISPELLKELVFSPTTREKVENRTKEIMQLYGYKTKKRLFKNLRIVSIRLMDNQFVISTTHQDGLDYSFTGIDNIGDFILDKNCSDEELGQTVKLAYEKCTSIY